MPRLVLVRHAQSENNVNSARVREQWGHDLEALRRESARVRQSDPPLSELGRQQLAPLAARLGPLARESSTLLVASPMRRALATATAIAREAEIGRERFVCEGSIYEIGGCHYCGVAQPSTTPAAIEDEWPVRCEHVDPAGWYAGRERIESTEQAAARVAGAVEWIEGQLASGHYSTFIVVAHGDLLSRWLRQWLGVPTTRGLAFAHANTAITTLDWHPSEGLQMRGFNDASHLPPELHTGDDAEAWWRYAQPDRARTLADV